ncbi:MAG: phosphate-starvation-inducible PsiE family protein [Melioribacteraceae bacterium]|nr:phosphate-starvation-inducible PsiE family protein [Melioribacteraceae bacterium]
MKTKINLESLISKGESAIYVIIAFFLFISAALLIYNEVITIFHFTENTSSIKVIIELIAKTLLLLMIIEILATIKISIKEHTLSAEPFLMVGLIAAIRRILIISVETAYVHELFTSYMIETGVLIILVFIFVLSIVLLRKHQIK